MENPKKRTIDAAGGGGRQGPGDAADLERELRRCSWVGEHRPPDHQPTQSSGEGSSRSPASLPLSELYSRLRARNEKGRDKGSYREDRRCHRRRENNGSPRKFSGPDKEKQSTEPTEKTQHESQDRDLAAEKTDENELFSSG